MLNKRRKQNQRFGAIAVLALTFLVLYACKKSSPEYPAERHENTQERVSTCKGSAQPWPGNILKGEYVTIYKNFKIEKVRMSRVSMANVPSTGYALYLLEVYTKACTPVTESKVSPDVMGPLYSNYQDGSLTPVCEVIFKKSDGKAIAPKPLRWSERGEKVSCNLNISRKNQKKSMWGYYDGDYKELPLNLTQPMKYGHESPWSTRNLRDTLFYLISFDKRSVLPDSVIVVFPDRRLKAAVNNSRKKDYILRSHTQFAECWDTVMTWWCKKHKIDKKIMDSLHYKDIYNYKKNHEKKH